SVGRNILPFMPRRCALAAAMIGASAFTMRHISSGTRSSRARTGSCISRRAEATGAWARALIVIARFGVGASRRSLRALVDGVQAVADVAELDIDREDALVVTLG